MQRIEVELEQLEKNGQLRIIPSIEIKSRGRLLINGVEYVNFASNDYLDISTNLKLKEEFLNQNNSLMSSASARLLTGTSEEFNRLERTVSNLFKKS